MGVRNFLRRNVAARKRDVSPLVDSLEPRRLFAATPVGSYAFGGRDVGSLTDADGTVVRFSLAAGQGTVTVAEDGWHVAVSKSSPGGSLLITAAGGDGRVSLAEFASAGRLGSVNAAKANLSGSMNLSNVKSVTLAGASDLSITSSTPLTSVTATSWSDTDDTPDTLTAPSVTTLKVKGNFAPALTLTSKQTALKSATVGGTVTGSWSVAGSAGNVKVHAVRSSDFSIAGKVGNLSLDDYVAISEVASATGGVIHLGDKGSVSAAKGKDKFKVAKNTTLYTCTADMYTWEELYQYTQLDRSWTYKENGKTTTSHVLPATQRIGGHDAFVLQDTGVNGGTSSFYMDDEGRGHLLSSHDSTGTYTYDDLLISPAVYQFGTTLHSKSMTHGHGSEDGVSIGFSGQINFTTRLAGHALVTTPAGTFLAVRIGSSVGGTFKGSASNGVQSVSLTFGLSVSNVDYVVPGFGVVKADDSGSAKISVPAVNVTESHKESHHSVLTSKGP